METRSVWLVEDLEYRQNNREIRGRFPYNSQATVASGGVVRKEEFAPRAFGFAVEAQDRELNLLRGHSFDQVIGRRPAGRAGGNMEVADSDAGLDFLVRLPAEAEQTAVQRDVVLQLRQGLLPGVSPGFQVPANLPNAETLLPEVGNATVMVRRINEALLFELSLVVRPAYVDSTVDVRQDPAVRINEPLVPAPALRWRRWL